MIRYTLQSTVSAAALLMAFGTASAFAADVMAPATYDWTGFYLGGVVGYGSTTSDAKVDYQSPNRIPATPIEGNLPPPTAGSWVNGEFHGDVYDTLASFYAFNTVGSSFYSNDPMPGIARWVTSMSDDAATFAGTALAGYDYQAGNLIIGAELRAAFGDFGSSNSWSASSGGTKTGYADSEGNAASFGYIDFGDVLDPSDITPNNQAEGVTYSGTYTQNAKLQADTQFDYLISPVARLGFAVDRFQFFGMAGPAFANVKATTSATISESLSGYTDGDESSRTDFTANKTYRFSGSNSENLWGYTIGGGSQWAVTDNVILRVEGEYHNLGDVTVKGTSANTDSSYKVKQTIDGYTISTGIIFKL